MCLLAQLSRRLIGELIVYAGIRRPSNDFSSEVEKPILFIFHIKPSIGRGNEKLCVLFRLDKNSAYSFHRPIMGKVEIGIFFSVSMGIFGIFLTEMFIE